MIKKILFKKNIFDFSKITASFNLKPQEFAINKCEKALCLAPHADDESIGMGGVLSLYAENFDVILLTDGRKGIKNLPLNEIIETRKNEFEQAMKIASIKNFSYLDCQDKKLLWSENKFCEIDIANYDYIFIPNIIDQHPDHKAVALNLSKLLKIKEHKSNLKICFYEVWSALSLVNAFVDITDAVDRKKEMIASYASQTSQKDYEYHALGLNQYRGMLKDKKFVEAFCVLNTKDFNKLCKIYD